MRTIGLVAMAALLMLPASSPATNLVVTGPLLAPGDTWTYRTNTSLGAGLSLDGRVTLTVTGHAGTEVEGRTYDAYILSVSGSGTATGTAAIGSRLTQASGDWTVTGREVVDDRGLKILSTVLDLEANGTLHTDPFPVPFALTVQNTTSYRLESDAWQFPLAVGATAVVPSRMNFSEDFRLVYPVSSPPPTHSAGMVWWNVTHSLEAAVAVDTPAGVFDTYPIRETHMDGSFTISFFAPVAGNHARTEAHNGTSTVGTANLVSYRYQALEPPTFLGLTTDQWAIVVVTIGAIGIAFVWWFRRKKRTATVPSPPPPTVP